MSMDDGFFSVAMTIPLDATRDKDCAEADITG